MIVAFWNNPKARLGCVVVLTLVTFAAIGLLTDPIISSGNKTDILLRRAPNIGLGQPFKDKMYSP